MPKDAASWFLNLRFVNRRQGAKTYHHLEGARAEGKWGRGKKKSGQARSC
jgi:hypothetical protein